MPLRRLEQRIGRAARPAAGPSNCQSVWGQGALARRVLGDDHGPASGDGSGAHGVLGADRPPGETATRTAGVAADGQLTELCRRGAADAQIGCCWSRRPAIAEGERST